MNTADKLRACKVTRWHMMDTQGHQQSIAEHSWAVAILALEIWQTYYQSIAGNTRSPDASLVQRLENETGGMSDPIYIRQAILEYALVHDLEEVMSGDVPTPIKTFVKTVCGFDPFDQFTHDKEPELWAMSERFKGTLVGHIVKAADLVESVHYFGITAADTPTNQKVGRDLIDGLLQYKDELAKINEELATAIGEIDRVIGNHLCSPMTISLAKAMAISRNELNKEVTSG